MVYRIYISPTNWQNTLSTSNNDEDVYNDQGCDADLYWSSGYLTLQNFIGGYLAQQYDGVDSDYRVSASPPLRLQQALLLLPLWVWVSRDQ